MGWIGDVAGGGANIVMGPRNRREAKKAAENNRKFVGSLDWEPSYASATAPKMQVSESPVARSYLESILTGNNPDTTFSGAPNSEFTKPEQQRSKDQMYGPVPEMLAREQAQKDRLNGMSVAPQKPIYNPLAPEALGAAGAGADVRPGTDLTPGQKALGALTFGAASGNKKEELKNKQLEWDMAHPEAGSYAGKPLTPEEVARLSALRQDPNLDPDVYRQEFEKTGAYLDTHRPAGRYDENTSRKGKAANAFADLSTFGIYSRKRDKAQKKRVEQWYKDHPDDAEAQRKKLEGG